MQSSRPEEARAMRDDYPSQHQRSAFEAGYSHAHGIACHCVPRIGATVLLEDGPTEVTEDNVMEVHEYLSLETEEHGRQFTPWEFTARDISDLDETEQAEAWEAYDEGVTAAIHHDMLDYDYDI
jgi:hypothetical protein